MTLVYDIKGQEYTTDFVLSGFWETDTLSNVGRLIVSKAFLESREDVLTYTYPCLLYTSVSGGRPLEGSHLQEQEER